VKSRPGSGRNAWHHAAIDDKQLRVGSPGAAVRADHGFEHTMVQDRRHARIPHGSRVQAVATFFAEDGAETFSARGRLPDAAEHRTSAGGHQETS